MTTQAIQTAGQIAQASSDNPHWIPYLALFVSTVSVYVALKNNWISNREAGKKALVQFYEYSKRAYDLALANIYGHEFDKEKYFHLLGVDVFIEMEKLGRTQQVKDAIDDLHKQFNILLAASNSKEDNHQPEDLLKILFYIREKSIWLMAEYKFRVYFWNTFVSFK